LKKNGTRWKDDAQGLTLVDSQDASRSSQSEAEDAATDSVAPAEGVEVAAPPASASRQAVALVAVSVACASAAIAAGSYAVWLTRRQATQAALTDVRDLLRTCQTRMTQMEDDLHRMPRGTAFPSARPPH